MALPTAKTPGYTSFRGHVACVCLAEWLPVFEAELLRRKVIKFNIDVHQLTGAAAASSSTHSKGGAFDIAQTQAESIKVGRQMGADAFWYRPKNWDGHGGMAHAHGVLTGCPHNVPARYQITEVQAGRNGLANRAKDTGPRPLSGRTWEEGIAWAKAQAAAASKPASETPPVTDSCTFNYLGMNIYASQYTGGKFSTGRKAALKATFAGTTGANASWNALSEVNSNLDHDTVVSLLGAQFNHSDTFTRAAGNNHHYPDANKWTKTGSKEVALGSTTAQARKITLVTARHKATGIVVSFWATHFSSATHGATPAQTAASQIVEAKAVARIIASKPLPDWDLAKSIGYADTNFDTAPKYIEPAGVKEIAHLVTVGNGELNSLHTLGKAPGKGYRRDNVFVGSKVKVVSARQIVGHYDATDHLGQACQFTVSS